MTDSARKRRPQERAEETKRKLIEVAGCEFSDRGFDAVTIRDIETRAGVQRSLINYHFGNKQEMWKAAARSMIASLTEYTALREELAQDLSTRERLAYSIRSYVRYASEHPELNRMMVQESNRDTWRMTLLLDELVRPGMVRFRALVKEELDWEEADFIHWWYVFIAGGAVIFSCAPEAKRLFAVDVTEESVVTKHANLMVDFLLSFAKDR